MDQTSKNAGTRIISGVFSALASSIICLIIGFLWFYIICSVTHFSESWWIIGFVFMLVFNLILSAVISLTIGMKFGQSHGLRWNISRAVIIGVLISNIIYIWGWSRYIF
jgi:hypothetical protein